MLDINQFVKPLEAIARQNGERPQTAFEDWIDLFALTINTINRKFKENEKRFYYYFRDKYNKEQRDRFLELSTQLSNVLITNPQDVLGQIYEYFNMGEQRLGQFFTPCSISKLMAELVMGNQVNPLDNNLIKEKIKEKGFITVNDPTCGSGSTLIESINHFTSLGYNKRKEVVVIAQDISLIVVKMCYIQLSLMDVPALVYHMDTLKYEVYDVYASTVFTIDGWQQRFFDEVQTHKEKNQEINQKNNKERDAQLLMEF